MVKVCIVCQKQVTAGAAVEDDIVISSIRKIKQMLKVAKNNTLVVCSDCTDEHQRKREKYEKNLAIHAVVAGGFLVLFILVPILTTGFSLSAVVLGLLLGALVMALSVFNHWPKAAGAKKEQAAKKFSRKR